MECLKWELIENSVMIDRLLSLLERDVESKLERRNSCETNAINNITTESNKSCDSEVNHLDDDLTILVSITSHIVKNINESVTSEASFPLED